MFKSIITTVFALFICASAFAENLNPINGTPGHENAQVISSEDGAIGIYVEVTLGRKRKDCEGGGVCKIKVGVDLDLKVPNPGNAGGGTFEVNSKNQLVLKLAKSSMRPEVISSYFGRGGFLVEEDYELEADVLKALRLTEPRTIRTGQYLVADDGNVLTIVF